VPRGRAGRKDDIIGEFNFTEPIEQEEGMIGLFNPDLEMPGPGDTIIYPQGSDHGPRRIERMKDEYYALRRWDVPSGLQKQTLLEDLRLSFVCGSWISWACSNEGVCGSFCKSNDEHLRSRKEEIMSNLKRCIILLTLVVLVPGFAFAPIPGLLYYTSRRATINHRRTYRIANSRGSPGGDQVQR